MHGVCYSSADTDEIIFKVSSLLSHAILNMSKSFPKTGEKIRIGQDSSDVGQSVSASAGGTRDCGLQDVQEGIRFVQGRG